MLNAITRLSRYYDNVDFQYDLEAAEEIINEDAGFTVVLFRIDRNHSNIDDIYGESDTRDIRFLAPVELRVILKLEDAENKTYGDNGSLRYQEHGNLIFDILNKELDNLNANTINLYTDVVVINGIKKNRLTMLKKLITLLVSPKWTMLFLEKGKASKGCTCTMGIF